MNVSTAGSVGTLEGAFEYRYRAHRLDIESPLPETISDDMLEVRLVL